MANNKGVFNSDALNVKYLSKPGLAGKGIISFARVKPGAQGSATEMSEVKDTAMLIEGAQIQFSRQMQRKFFLNSTGMGYIIGLGTGTFTVQGLLGKASDFTSVFGVDLNDPCKELLEVTLNVSGMLDCSREEANTGSGKIRLIGVVPQGVGVTTSIDANGTLYYQATASFEISGMTFED